MFDHYNLSNIRTAISEPYLFYDELRRVNRRLNGALYRDRHMDGFDVMAEEWDTLIILDGCRFDVFEDVHTFPGTVASVPSQGGHSNEFMRKTFWDRTLHDTVYVTANPWSEQIGDDVFFLTRTTYTEEVKGGRARLPEDVADLAIRTFEEYPDKRFIVHFMQPNNPYVGPKAREYRGRLLAEQGVLCTEMDTPGADSADVRREVQHLRRALRHGYISRDVMFEVYRENLEIVTEHAKRVMDELGGRTAITADHGDMFGERLPPLYVREYSHWEGVYTDYLRRVPWVVVESDDRRETRAETPVGREAMDDDSLREHLRSMGYLGD